MGKRGPKKGAPNAGAPRKLVLTDQTLREIENYAALGASEAHMAAILGITDRAWRMYKARNDKDSEKLVSAIEKGRSKGATFVMGKLRQLIQKDNVPAIIFYLKAQCGWRDRDPVGETAAPAREDADTPSVVVNIGVRDMGKRQEGEDGGKSGDGAAEQ